MNAHSSNPVLEQTKEEFLKRKANTTDVMRDAADSISACSPMANRRIIHGCCRNWVQKMCRGLFWGHCVKSWPSLSISSPWGSEIFDVRPSRRFSPEGDRVGLTASTGTSYAIEADRLKFLLSCAHRAMRTSESEGGNRVTEARGEQCLRS